MTSYCYKCSTALSLPSGEVSRGASCDKCSTDVRCCKNCRHYDTSSYNDCRERQAERVLDKERSNMCDYFQLAHDRKGGSEGNTQKASTLAALDDLFKK